MDIKDDFCNAFDIALEEANNEGAILTSFFEVDYSDFDKRFLEVFYEETKYNKEGQNNAILLKMARKKYEEEKRKRIEDYRNGD